MFFILGFLLLIWIVMANSNPVKPEICKGHKWSYWPDGRMRCDVCKRVPLED